jgi:hypothetical protein
MQRLTSVLLIHLFHHEHCFTVPPLLYQVPQQASVLLAFPVWWFCWLMCSCCISLAQASEMCFVDDHFSNRVLGSLYTVMWVFGKVVIGSWLDVSGFAIILWIWADNAPSRLYKLLNPIHLRGGEKCPYSCPFYYLLSWYELCLDSLLWLLLA